MRFEFLVAIRYLKAKRKQAVVSLITVISVIGVAAGVAALVIALAINAGFRRDLQDKLLGASAHITILKPTREGILNYRSLSEQAAAVEGVVAASPALHQTVLLSTGVNSDGVVIKGVIPELEAERSDVFDTLLEGRFEDLEGNSVIIGENLARSLGSFLGDRLQVMSAETRITPVGPLPRTRILEVVGIFKSGLFQFDSGWVFAPIGVVQGLIGAGDIASSIEVQIDDIDESETIATEILAVLDQDLDFTDWKTQNSSIFEALQLERLVMFITIGLIVIVASLNIVVTLVMMVLEKTRDIAVLMSMGATRENIRRVFVAQGVVIGVIGTFLGLIVGNLVSYLADAYRLVSLAPDVYSIAYVPFRLSPLDSVIVAVAAILISYLATIYPSRAASKLQPVEALRYE
jgi:lipoprotein-releasing system permease protein